MLTSGFVRFTRKGGTMVPKRVGYLGVMQHGNYTSTSNEVGLGIFCIESVFSVDNKHIYAVRSLLLRVRRQIRSS